MKRKIVILIALVILGLAIVGGLLWLQRLKRRGCAPTLTVDFAAGQIKFNWYCKGFGPQ